MATKKPLVVVVGGFLGAGKTTLILFAADLLKRRGMRVAVITNDQGENLVDTRRVLANGIDAAEIGGGCFCCRFSSLMDAANRVCEYQPDVIFAEPVGSCTDLVATVVRPLQTLYTDRFLVAPFTVLVDPGIAKRAMNGAGPDIRYLFESQIREADILCYSKADQYPQVPPMGKNEPLRLSAITGDGVARWLEMVTGWPGSTGANSLNIDYDQYAAAEASLGWLNARLDVDSPVPMSPAQFTGQLLDELDRHLSQAGASIVHLKLFDQTVSAFLKAGVVCNGQEPAVEGDLLAPAEHAHEVLINLRAVARPEVLRSVLDQVLKSLSIEGKIEIQAFAPAYPKPEKRMPDGGGQWAVVSGQ